MPSGFQGYGSSKAIEGLHGHFGLGNLPQTGSDGKALQMRLRPVTHSPRFPTTCVLWDSHSSQSVGPLFSCGMLPIVMTDILHLGRSTDDLMV